MLKIGFALVMAQALQGFVLDDNANMDTRLEVNNLYGSFSKALYTTFEITHSGSWPSRVRPVIEKVSPWYAIPFLTYITLVPGLAKQRHKHYNIDVVSVLRCLDPV